MWDDINNPVSCGDDIGVLIVTSLMVVLDVWDDIGGGCGDDMSVLVVTSLMVVLDVWDDIGDV